MSEVGPTRDCFANFQDQLIPAPPWTSSLEGPFIGTSSLYFELDPCSLYPVSQFSRAPYFGLRRWCTWWFIFFKAVPWSLTILHYHPRRCTYILLIFHKKVHLAAFILHHFSSIKGSLYLLYHVSFYVLWWNGHLHNSLFPFEGADSLPQGACLIFALESWLPPREALIF